MSEKRTDEVNFNLMSVWLGRARENAPRCFICNRIAQANSSGSAGLQTIRISGVEMTPETQIAHLYRCLGGKDAPPAPQGL